MRLAIAVVLAALTLPSAADAFNMRASGSLGRVTVAPEPQPLTGSGQNMRLVANVPMAGDRNAPAASDIELAGDYAYVGSYGEGVVIVDVSDPTQPKRVGVFDCPGGQNDVQLSPDAHYAVMAIDTKSNECHPGQEGSVILDISDKTAPRELAFIPIAVGSHNNTLDWPLLFVDNYPTSYHKLEVFTLADPTKPRKLSQLDFGAEADSVHDSYVDHRPDGRTLLYAASIGNTDVIDVSDPEHPRLQLRFADPRVSISHQAEPNFDRTKLLVTDEFLGGSEAPTCGQVGNVRLPVQLPLIGDPTNIGALHMYALNKDGSVRGNGIDGWLGSLNLPLTLNPSGGCTIHVFWQAPDEDRLVTAWYGRGVHAFDFSDPAHPLHIGSYAPTNGDVWSAKPHKGYIFTGDIVRGMDVLQYTGEGGKRWPATAGDAATQRAQTQGHIGSSAPAAPRKPPTGTYRFARRVRTPHTRASHVTLTVDFRDRGGKLVSKLRFKARSGRVVTLHARAGGLAGRYRYVIKHGGRVLGRGAFTVKGSASSKVGLKPGQVLVCRLG
jgi:hypothetical protein